MRVAAYIALHYGKDYLPYAIKSVINSVDKLIVLYASRPSYGHANSLPCPETEEELRQIARDQAGDKLQWVNIRHTHMEGDHRNQAFAHSNGFDILAVVDSDEVWDPEAFNIAVEFSAKSQAFNIGANHSGWFHFWRSFNEYCQDGFCPIRFHNLKGHRGMTDINCPSKIYHFGYAQKLGLMDYKWSCHGHQDELRTGWKKTFLNYEKGKDKWLHPVSEQIWHETQDFNKETFPDFMKDHPFYNLDRIE